PTVSSACSLFSLVRPPPLATLVPYTTLFRSTRQRRTRTTSSPTTTRTYYSTLPITSKSYPILRFASHLPLSPFFCFPVCSTDATDRKSTRLNSSHVSSSYAVFCLKDESSQSS